MSRTVTGKRGVDSGRSSDPALSASRKTDEAFMARALELAAGATEAGEVPVAAIIVEDGRVLAESTNRTRTDSDPSGHAEMVALRRAAKLRGDWRLDGTTLYSTLEPCAMCAGAIVLARVPQVVFGAFDPKAGMAGSLGNLLQDSRLNHRCEVVGGVLAERSARLLRSFFATRRQA